MGSKKIVAAGVILLGTLIMVGGPMVYYGAQMDVERRVPDAGDVAMIEQALRNGSGDTVSTPREVVGFSAASAALARHAEAREGLLAEIENRDEAELFVPDPDVEQVIEDHGMPTHIRIDAIDVDAPVDAFGLDSRGRMDVAANTTDVSWYENGPIPGQAGSAAMAAHVVWHGKKGVFHRLKDLEPGDPVEITYEDGGGATFVAVARATYDKQELPLDVVFATNGPPVLTLVTCGGNFSAASGHYDSNIVIYAIPLSDYDALMAESQG